MSKTDKKTISILLIVMMLFALVNPVISNAANDVPEDVVEFEDAGLAQALKNIYWIDENHDGYLTKQELENVHNLSVSSPKDNPIKSFEELKYFPNLESLSISGLDENTIYDLTSLTNLKSFSIAITLKGEQEGYHIDKNNIKTSDRFFICDSSYILSYSNDTMYNIYGSFVEDKIEIAKNEMYEMNGTYPEILKNIKIENENIAKIPEGRFLIEGINEGNTKITFTSNFMTMEVPLTVTKANVEINPDQELENNGITSRIIYNRVLMSNGTLWKINSEDEAEVEDTNVSDFVYSRYYSSDSTDDKVLYATLKDDGNLKVSINTLSYAEENEVSATTEIQNVKQVLVNKNYRNAYLTNNNEVYSLDLNVNTKQIETKLIADNVTSAKAAFYVKDGATYYINGELVAEGVMTDARRNAVAIGNSLYTVKDENYPYSGPQFEIKSVATDFSSFLEDYYSAYYVTYKTTSGEIKSTSGSEVKQGIKFELTPATDGTLATYPISLDNNNTLCRYNLKYLNNVTDMTVIYGIIDDNIYFNNPLYIIAVREDGSVWTKNYGDEVSNFKKIISTDDEEDVQLGNLDDDDEVTIKDVKLTLQFSLHKEDLSEVQIKAADVNKDGEVNIKDVKLILQYSLKKISEF